MASWIPVSGRNEACGCAWLPRMIQKARRIVDSGAGTKRVDDYIFGRNDPVDGMLLRFLGISDDGRRRGPPEAGIRDGVSTLVLQRGRYDARLLVFCAEGTSARIGAASSIKTCIAASEATCRTTA